ncbi:MAG: phosphatidate cytidylyltransferase [Paracoccaceae bacterium]
MTQAGGQWSDLAQRLISGGLFAVLGLFVMWIGGIPFHILVSVIAGIMVWEVTRMIGGGNRAMPLGALTGVALMVLVELPPGFALPLLFVPALVGISQLEEHKTTYALYTSAVLFASFGLIALRDDFGFIWMVWLALIVIFSDILGYFAGRIIGGPKFWPKVSPKKTWSGTIAGWIGAAIIGVVYVAWGKAGAEIIGISIALAIAGQLGDVAESALKRRMDVKDSSNILPGHGGMFDRFDSMLGASILLLLMGQVVGFPPVAP